jgi:hypothetical protein
VKKIIVVMLALATFCLSSPAWAGSKCRRCYAPYGGEVANPAENPYTMSCSNKIYEEGGATCIIYCEDLGCSCWTTGECDGIMCSIDDPIEFCEEGAQPTTMLAAPKGSSFAARLLQAFHASRSKLTPGPIEGLMQEGKGLIAYKGRITVESTGALMLDLDVAGKATRIETWARGRGGRVTVDGTVTQTW